MGATITEGRQDLNAIPVSYPPQLPPIGTGRTACKLPAVVRLWWTHVLRRICCSSICANTSFNAGDAQATKRTLKLPAAAAALIFSHRTDTCTGKSPSKSNASQRCALKWLLVRSTELGKKIAAEHRFSLEHKQREQTHVETQWQMQQYTS
jgi:hypothetical protein